MKTLILATMAALAIAGTAGCALTSKADAMSVRWFTPETVKPRITSAGGDRIEGPSLELGRVSSGMNLREKIAYRDAAYEVGYYDDRRWTERPEVFVRRELSRTLFEEYGMRRALAGQSPILDVEVLAFEELRAPHAARVQLRLIVRDDTHALLEKTITVDRPVAGGSKEFDGLIQAMAQALDAAANETAKETEAALRRSSPR